MSRKGYLVSALASLCLLMATVLFLVAWGRTHRVFGSTAFAVGRGKVEVVAVERPEEAFRAWTRRGLRGRVVVTFSRRLNFLETGETRLIPPTSPFPVPVANLARLAEKELSTDTFLFVAMKSGVARELIQVVPDSDMAAKRDAAAAEGLVFRQGRLHLPVMGSPRSITSPAFFIPPREPVLLYVNASFFRDVAPDELLRLLVRTGTTTDCVVLASSPDDGEVSQGERERLLAFKRLLEGGYGGK